MGNNYIILEGDILATIYMFLYSNEAMIQLQVDYDKILYIYEQDKWMTKKLKIFVQ